MLPVAILDSWLGSRAEMAVFLIGAAALVVAALAVGLYLLLGKGPRRSRAFRRAQRLLHDGDWQQALAILQQIEQSGRQSVAWQGRLRSTEGECHHAAADAALRDKQFEDSLQHYQAAARLLNLDEAELRARVIETMLAEVRRLFAAGPEHNEATHQLVARTLLLQSPCPEASFWQGLCQVRAGELDLAIQALTTAHEGGGKRFVDPPLYIGVLHFRAGRLADALRYLSEANRLDPSCPFITWQLGSALVAANGDAGLAARALQRALGPRGLSLWLKAPDRAWVEAFPEARSYVRRLASKHSYVCPVLGNDIAAMVRAGQLALAQAHYRQGDFQQAADLYGKLLQDAPPSVPLLRGLGLSLARLDRYDQAYKHLRAALEQEEPKNPFTAGYLALCGAMGKPLQPEDKVKNVLWAVRLLSRFDVPNNTEWARIYSTVFVEARLHGIAVPAEDQVRLCDVLAGVSATDPAAAAAYAHLAATAPDAVRSEYAWLYCKAAREHGFSCDRDLDLFGRTFREEPAARAFYQQRGWDFDEVAFTYLERCAAQRPGQFPEELGPDYPRRGEALLLEQSRKQELAGHRDAAFATAEVLLKLAPRSTAAHNRLAHLSYQRGDLDRAAALLDGWQELEPANHWPAIRKAIIEEQRANAAGRAEAIRRALGLTHGRVRAAVAFLGARLAVASALGVRGGPGGQVGHAPHADTLREGHAQHALQEARDLFRECLRDAPHHVDALWCLAAVHSAVGDTEGLAAHAPAMNRPDVADARFQYLAAVCHLAARDFPKAVEAGQRAAGTGDATLAVESQYVLGWAYLHLQDAPAAATAFQKVASAAGSPSADHARAVLGQLSFARGDYEGAIKWWNAVDAKKRAEWKFDEALRQTVYLSGL
ncbi:MAG TPA: tetratricopeptide repeat protein, partial [Gemmataceae bacterium]|nr:tetratricopeptide repeat protein [Gemmataceae bacterium]